MRAAGGRSPACLLCISGVSFSSDMTRIKGLLIILFLGAAGLSWTQEKNPALSPLPLAGRLAAEEEPLSQDSMIEAALVFSGTPEASLDGERQALHALTAEFDRRAAGIKDQNGVAREALAFLHEKILKAYLFTQTRVDAALDTGVYNCVSASVLYMILADSAGLSVSGVRTSDHAFCSVLVDGKEIDVETTNPYGYDPGTRKDFTDSFGMVTGFSYVPTNNSRDRRAIGEKELLGLILYNRASFEIQRGSYQTALQPAASAYALLGSDESLKALRIAVLDYTSMRGQQRKFSEALQLLTEAEGLYGTAPELQTQRRTLLEGQVVALVDAGSFSDAQALLQAYPQVLDQTRKAELSVYLIQKKAEAEARGGDYAAAAAVIRDGLALYPGNASLLRAFEVYVHNLFAGLYNARRFQEARDVLTAARGVYADSAALAQDMRAAEQALSR